MSSLRDNADGQLLSGGGLSDADQLALLLGVNAAGLADRLRCGGDNADAIAAIAAGAQRALSMDMLYNGVTWERYRTANVFKNLSAVVITAETTIWTPQSGKKFRLMGALFTQGVATGAVTLKDGTGGTTIIVIPQHTLGQALPIWLGGNGYLSSTANNVLTATGVATETLTGCLFGTEE